jgi:hypothetical protein
MWTRACTRPLPHLDFLKVCVTGLVAIASIGSIPVSCRPFLADSVDSDYVIIGLCQIEKHQSEGKPLPRIMVRRIEIKEAGVKRARVEGSGSHETKPRRQYEFVDCLKLAEHVTRHLRSNYTV